MIKTSSEYKHSNSHFNLEFNRLFPKWKHSQAHVEMMLSFALFLGALIFIFVFLNPFSKNISKTDSLGDVQDKLINNFSYNIGQLSVVSYNASTWCYKLNPTDYSNKPYIEIEQTSSLAAKKYIIYFSDLFSASSPHNDISCDNSNYSVGIYKVENIIVYEKLKSVTDNCKTGCKDYKNNIGIKNDFTYNVNTIDGTPVTDLSFTKRVPLGFEANAIEFPIMIINSTGQINNYIFNLKVW